MAWIECKHEETSVGRSTGYIAKNGRTTSEGIAERYETEGNGVKESGASNGVLGSACRVVGWMEGKI